MKTLKFYWICFIHTTKAGNRVKVAGKSLVRNQVQSVDFYKCQELRKATAVMLC